MKKRKLSIAKRCLVMMLCISTTFTCLPLSVFAEDQTENIEMQSEEPLSCEEEAPVSETPSEVVEETIEVPVEEIQTEETIIEDVQEIQELQELQDVEQQTQENINTEVQEETIPEVEEIPVTKAPARTMMKMMASPKGGPVPHKINVSITPSETGSINVADTAAKDQTVEFNITANSGYRLKTVVVSKVSGGAVLFSSLPNDSFIMPDEDVNIEVVFEEKVYKVSTLWAPAAGGSVEVSKTSAQAGESITVTVKANAGYELKSYDIIRDDDVLVLSNCTKASETFVMPSDNVTVIASFKEIQNPEPVKFTVSFDANGGEGTMNSFMVEKDTTIDVPECKFTRSGYHFTYWTIDGKEVTDHTVVVTKDITFVANWVKDEDPIPVTYDVRYIADNGTSDEYTDKDIPDGTKYTIKNCMFSYEDYHFVGWKVPDGMTYKAGDVVEVHSNKIYIACWEKDPDPLPIEYTVYFDANGGTGTMAPVTGIKSGTVFKIPSCAFTRSGYHFTYWTVDGVKAEDSITITKDITLVANWKKNDAPKPPAEDPKDPEPKNPEPQPQITTPSTTTVAPQPKAEVKDNTPKLPQTGGLAENVWVPIVLGLGIIAIGAWLFYSQKKKRQKGRRDVI